MLFLLFLSRLAKKFLCFAECSFNHWLLKWLGTEYEKDG